MEEASGCGEEKAVVRAADKEGGGRDTLCLGLAGDGKGREKTMKALQRLLPSQ